MNFWGQDSIRQDIFYDFITYSYPHYLQIPYLQIDLCNIKINNPHAFVISKCIFPVEVEHGDALPSRFSSHTVLFTDY